MEQTIMSKATEAQLRASDKYKKENIVNVALQFNKRTEPDLTDYVRSLPNKTAYIKNLIRADVGEEMTSYVLCVNDEDEIRYLPLHNRSKAEALAEAEQIVSLFDGWLKARISKEDWHIIKGIVDDSSPTGLIEDDEEEPIYLYR